MKYKIETLKIGGDKSVDIPKGYIPVKYDCSIERRDPSVSFVRTLTILRPIGNIDDKEYIEEEKIDEKEEKINEKIDEERCFFCEKNLTRDKVGIRPICPICLGELYGLARESHKSFEC